MKKKLFLMMGLPLIVLFLCGGTSSVAALTPLSKLTPARAATGMQIAWLSNKTVQQARREDSTGLGELIIQNGTEYDAQVKVVSPSTNTTAYTTYVRSHDDDTIKGIRDGTYTLAFWLGKDWDSGRNEFRDGFGKKFTNLLEFKTTDTQYTVWTVTLHTVPGGNAPTKDISRDEFRGYK